MRLEAYFGEQKNAEDGEEEKKEEEEGADICEFRDSQQERVENLLQALGLANELQYAKNAEGSHNGGQGANIDIEYELRDEANPSENDNQEVEIVPAVLVVAGLVCNQFDYHLDCVDDRETNVDPLHDLSEPAWLPEPGNRKT